MQAYSQERRDEVLRALEQGLRPNEIAEQLKVSRAWVYNVQKRYRDTGARDIRRIGGYRRSKLAQLESRISAWFRSQPNWTVAKIQELLADEGISIKTGALWHQLDKWGLTLQKNAVRRHARLLRRVERQALKSKNKDRK
jgi:transposase